MSETSSSTNNTYTLVITDPNNGDEPMSITSFAQNGDTLKEIAPITLLTGKQFNELDEEQRVPVRALRTLMSKTTSTQGGGTHHTRKRAHKPRNTKSNTRKVHIYRKNRRRTHGKSSAHGKKQTRRIANR